MTEAEIRADERRKIIEELNTYTVTYVEKWAPIVGDTRAKADAWNITVAAGRLRDNGTG